MTLSVVAVHVANRPQVGKYIAEIMSGQKDEEKIRRASEDQKEPISYWSETERGQKAEQRLVNHPYDLESWGVLIREAQGMTLEKSKVLYEKLVRRFPSAGRYWRLYIEQEVFSY